MAMTPTDKAPPLQRVKLGLLILACLGSGLSSAQEAEPPTDTAPKGTGTLIQPTLDGVLVLTNNVQRQNSPNAHADSVMAVSPGVNILSQGANSRINGQFQLTGVHSFQGQQKDAVLPRGELLLHTQAPRLGLGLDGALSASQVQAQFNSTTTDIETPQTSGAYTQSLLRLSPFFEASIDELTRLSARLDRSLQHSTTLDSTLPDRADIRLRDDGISLSRQPSRWGYTLMGRSQETRIAGQTDAVVGNDTVQGTLRYALTPEFELGLMQGHDRTLAPPVTFNGAARGVSVDWHPSNGRHLQLQAEHHPYGRTWFADYAHHSPFLALGLHADRTPGSSLLGLGTVGANGSVRDLFDALLLTRIPDPTQRSQAVNDLLAQRNLSAQLGSARSLYDPSAQLIDTTSARMALLGRRDTLLLQAGMIKTQPLAAIADGSVSSLLSQGPTAQRFFETQLSHQLTPKSSLSGSLRWTSGRQLALDGSPLSTRDVGARLIWRATLARNTTALVGLRRVWVRDNAGLDASETAVFMGMGYRF